MKQLLIGIALLLVIALFCTVNHFLCRRITEETVALMERGTAEESYARWQSGCRYLAFVIPNDHLHAVDEQFAALQNSISGGDRQSVLTIQQVIRNKLEAISQSTSLKPGDLF